MTDKKKGPIKVHTMRSFKGMNSQPGRQGIEDDQFYYLEGLMPIASGNLAVVPGETNNINLTAVTLPLDQFYAMFPVTIGFVSYMIMPGVAGACLALNLLNGSTKQVAPAGTFGGVGLQVTQWKNERALIADPATGYWDWDGTTLTHNTTLSAPATGSFIASYSGRVWIASGRTWTYSAPNSYQDFTTASAGGSFIVTDSTLTGNITGCLSANNFLYYTGASSVYVISDVRVVSGSPNVTVFSNTTLVTSVGTTYPLSLISYYRTVWMATSTGFYSIFGSTARKGSVELEGVWPNVDLTRPISAGLATLNGQLVLCFNVFYKDPRASFVVSKLMCWAEGKWFMVGINTNTGSSSFSSIIVNGYQPIGSNGGYTLYYLGNNNVNFSTSSVVGSFFTSTTQKSAWKLRTKLFDLGNPTATKDCLKLGAEINYASDLTPITVSVDTENSRSERRVEQAPVVKWYTSGREWALLYWVTNAGILISWSKNNAPIAWVDPKSLFTYGDFAQAQQNYPIKPRAEITWYNPVTINSVATNLTMAWLQELSGFYLQSGQTGGINNTGVSNIDKLPIVGDTIPWYTLPSNLARAIVWVTPFAPAAAATAGFVSNPPFIVWYYPQTSISYTGARNLGKYLGVTLSGTGYPINIQGIILEAAESAAY